jgi:hydroxyacylglutathione hydrolase
MSSRKKGNENHSRCIEQRVELVKGRIFCHPVPQLLDNLAYLVVCLPESKQTKIVAFLVDCGDAQAAHNIILDIQDLHYPDQTIELQAILSTHKHHDHTAGNKGILQDETFGQTVSHIYGGAVERVPHCTTPVADGDMLDLPKLPGNDMNDHVWVEVVAVPGHTRGSVAYAMRSKVGDHVVFCFTGDTMFSGGGGVAFEADVQPKSDTSTSNKKASSYIRASAGSNATERCFAEIIVRSLGEGTGKVEDRVLIFPGHEYTYELVNRQFQPSAGETSHWNKMAPSVFFETASHLFVSQHRRTLPKDGKLLTIPTPLSREIMINPVLRKMKRRGEDVIKAVQQWNRLFEQPDVVVTHDPNGGTLQVPTGEKTQATEESWTLEAKDFSKSVFTTVYTADLEALIDGLNTGTLSRDVAVQELKNLKTRLDEPLIGRRPIPNTLPSERIIYQAILGFCLLGSPPSALTISDSRLMNLRAPVNPSKADKILISKTRVVAVLQALGLLQDGQGNHLAQMIHSLWAHAWVYSAGSEIADTENHENGDEITLGALKWMLYGIEERQSSSPILCLPCMSIPKATTRDHPFPRLATSMRITNGELVRHDVATCRLCRYATGGCPPDEEASSVEETKPNLPRSSHEACPPRSAQKKAPSAGARGVNGNISNNGGQTGRHDDFHTDPQPLAPVRKSSVHGRFGNMQASKSMPDKPWDEHDDSDSLSGVEVEVAKSFP